VRQNHEHEISTLLRQLDGFFALLFQSDYYIVAAVDYIASHRLFYETQPNKTTISPTGLALVDQHPIDTNQAFMIATSGYSFGHHTLYQGIKALKPGQFIFIDKTKNQVAISSYNTWSPWKVQQKPPKETYKRCRDVTISIIEKLVKIADGRPIGIPLSSGRDSRLIASLLRHQGVKDVFCFTYGRSGNREISISQAVAKQLGYRWRFVKHNQQTVQRQYANGMMQHFIERCGNIQSAPMINDLLAIDTLLAENWLPQDALIVNGTNGDFISGDSASRCLIDKAGSIDDQLHHILDQYIHKHHALWACLLSEHQPKQIMCLLKQEVSGYALPDLNHETMHGIYERLEFENRQSKYILDGQRSYEALDLEWWLPLWDKEYLDFWESVPLSDKLNQSLYAKMLHQENWGNVWRIPINPPTKMPISIKMLRGLLKGPFAFTDRRHWQRFDRRFFRYWYEEQAPFPTRYSNVCLDHRGQRHIISAITEHYLYQFHLSHDLVKNMLSLFIPFFSQD
jgi:asparagine synthase (glutamine-hydrolysing)